MNEDPPFSAEQQEYLRGFVAGCDAVRQARRLPTFADTLRGNAPLPPIPGLPSTQVAANDDVIANKDQVHRRAQDAALAAGQKLTPEEDAKRRKDPFGMWDEMTANAEAGRFPKGTDIFLYKYHGLFYVSPAQNAFMSRLRFPGGMTTAWQMRGVADLAERLGGGYVDVTTRANLQVREIGADRAVEFVTGLIDLGIINRGSGADNIRNVTGSPTAGIDSDELIDTRPLTHAMHHYILQHREMYGLPRKFNIAFDGGGRVSSLADTNDIGFEAVQVNDGAAIAAGVYFRLELGGISGHKDFAQDTGVLLKPNECVPAAAALVQTFNEHGDRTDRKKARLKYVLERLGFEGYLQAAEKHYGSTWRRFPLDQCDVRRSPDRIGHIGVHEQRQPGLYYIGVVLPVGRLRSDQLRGLAEIATRYGSGTLRLTVWQNVLISDIPLSHLEAAQAEIIALGLHWSATNLRAGLVACTGNTGCRFAAANTKRTALKIADYLESRLELDQPLNIHVTGCPHSCAQHYIGDMGLLATKVPVGDDLVEGFHIYVGGGYADQQAIGRELLRNVPTTELPAVLERMLKDYLEHRLSNETYFEYTRRHSTESLLSRMSMDHSPAGAFA